MLSLFADLATDPTTTTAVSQSSPMLLIIDLVLIVLAVAAMWRIFEKAGEAGWMSIVPIFNTIVLLKIAGKEWWWVLLLFIPLVNIVVILLVALALAKSFGKSSVFGVVALFFFSIIGYLILGFGSASYIGPGGVAVTTPVPAPPVPPTV